MQRLLPLLGLSHKHPNIYVSSRSQAKVHSNKTQVFLPVKQLTHNHSMKPNYILSHTQHPLKLIPRGGGTQG